MYEKFFGLTENPFSLTPDPKFVYQSRGHDEALAYLRYWVEHRESFVMVTGEVGTGKTTTLFRLIDALDRDYEVALVNNSTLTPVELLEEICRKFGLEVESHASKPALLSKLESHLTRLADRGHGAILIIDEAQNFERHLLEEVRLLSNMTRPGGPLLLQIALVGQPELEAKLEQPDLRQLRQRIGLHYKIAPLTEAETAKYVHHRVGVAGGAPLKVFPDATLATLHQRTHGLPREINQLAGQAMLHAYVDRNGTVLSSHVDSAAEEMRFVSVMDRGREVTARAAKEVVQPAQVAAPAPPPAPEPEFVPVPPPPVPVVTPPPAPAPAPVVTPPAPAPPAPGDAFITPPSSSSDGPSRPPAFIVIGSIVLVIAGVWWGIAKRMPHNAAPAKPATQSIAPAADSTPAPVAAVPVTPDTTAAAPAQTVVAEKPFRGIPACPYRIQVSSLRDSVAADELGATLAGAAHMRYDIAVDRSRGAAWFAVILGPFQTRSEAEAASLRLNAINPNVTRTILRSTAASPAP